MLEYKGRRPRFNPAHFAAKGCRWSVVSTGASAINLCAPTSKPTSQVSAPTLVIDPNLGVASKFTGVASNGIKFVGGANAAEDLVLTYACKIRPSSVASTFSILSNSTTVNSGSLLSYNVGFGSLVVGFELAFPILPNINLVAGVPYCIIVSGSGAAGGTWNTNWGVLRMDTGQITTTTASQSGQSMAASDGNMIFGGANSSQGNNDATGNLSEGMYAGGPGAVVLSIPQIVQWLQAEYQDQFGAGPGSFWYERRQLNRAMLFSQPASGGSPTGNLTSAAGIGVAGSLTSSVATGGLTQAAGIGVAQGITVNPAALLIGAAGTGVAGSLTTTASGNGTLPPATGIGVAGSLVPTLTITLAQAIGTGTAGSLSGADSSTLAPATGTGVAGQLSASVSVAFSGAIGTGVAGSIGSLDIPGIVGVAGTGVAHGIAPQVSAFLSGAAGTGQAGTFSFAGAGTGNLTGVAGTGVSGGISASIQGFFAGAFGTGVAHTFTAEVDKTLTGVAGIGVAGTLTTTSSGTGTLVGVSGIGSAGNLNGQDGKGITGAAGTGVAHVGNAEVDHGLTGGVGTGVAGQLSSTATGNVSIGLIGVAGIGVAGIITANVPAPPVATGGGNGGSLPAPKRRKTIPRPIEAPKPKVETVLLPPSIARPTPAVARSLPPEPSFTHPLMGALAPARTPIVKPDDSEDEHAIAMLLEQQIAAERPIREAISQMLIDIMKSIETEIA